MQNRDQAECGNLTGLLQQLGGELDRYLRFEHADAMQDSPGWRERLGGPLPEQGVGIAQVMAELGQDVIPNGSQIPNPGCTSFITTGATSVGALAQLAGAVASPQRLGLTAFNFLEELSLDWLARLLELPAHMKGVYSSGGSVANLVALGAARQWAFEQQGMDPARDGISRPCRIYATEASHRTIHRAAAVLGLGRNGVVNVPADLTGRMLPGALRALLQAHSRDAAVPVAVVANAGTTSTGAVDPLRELGSIARAFGLWFHVDGAYGLPGILDESVRPLFDGLELADSVIVDPHKWLGAPVGIGATFVRDRNILNRAFTQGASDYLEGSVIDEGARHSMDSLGIPYSDFGVELSAPSRGAVVWALLREIGREGIRERISRHIAMARHVAEQATKHPHLEVVQQPTLSICCIRYIAPGIADLNEFNRAVHRLMIQRGRSMPSTAVINGVFAIRPCFVGARTTFTHADEMIEEIVTIGAALRSRDRHENNTEKEDASNHTT